MHTSQAMEICNRFASRDETRMALTYVNVEPTRVWATDGHRAHIITVENEPATVGAYVERLAIRCPERSPVIDHVIPFDPPVVLTLDRGHHTQLAELIAVFKQTSIVVVFDKAEAWVRVTRYFRRKEFETALSLRGSWPKASGHACQVNLRYLVEALEALQPNAQGEWALHQTDDRAPVLIRDDHSTHVLMPAPIK